MLLFSTELMVIRLFLRPLVCEYLKIFDVAVRNFRLSWSQP